MYKRQTPYSIRMMSMAMAYLIQRTAISTRLIWMAIPFRILMTMTSMAMAFSMNLMKTLSPAMRMATALRIHHRLRHVEVRMVPTVILRLRPGTITVLLSEHRPMGSSLTACMRLVSSVLFSVLGLAMVRISRPSLMVSLVRYPKLRHRIFNRLMV